MPDSSLPRVLVYYAVESRAHLRGIQNLLAGLRNAGISSVQGITDPEIDAASVRPEDIDWLLIVWSPTVSARLASDLALKDAVELVRHAFLVIDPPKRFPLPPLFERALHMLLGDASDILWLADRLMGVSDYESALPPPAPSRGGETGAALGPPPDIEKEEIKKMGEPPAGSGADGPHVPDQGIIYPVWYGTNRKPAEGGNDSGGGFSGERYYKTLYGRVDVRIPEAHRFGEIGTSFWKRLLRFDLRDDRLRVQKIVDLEHDACFQEIHAALQAAFDAGNQPHALLFIHGFNVTFEEAAIRSAQIGYDLKVPGPTAFFSWPSKGDVHRYKADEASIEASEQAITEFLVDFAAQCQGAKIHLIAHSMGNRGLLRSLQRIAGNAEIRGKVWFDQIFLAAPDVDRDLFLQMAHLYPQHAGRTTLYASNGDLPVFLSGKLHEAPRAGYFRPYTIAPGIDTIAVPDFDVDLLGHSYYAQAEALLYDIQALMRHNPNPPDRPRMHDALDEGKVFWKLGL
ncbi:MAG: alpha/beta hydrolase [Rhodothermales bacterium]|nr:alpha/beta hydrolase [Rhodothermales bacterium]